MERESHQQQQQQPWRSCGFIAWPPRSYPCSFCKREFRSAQALGGHMNVHRRDRARLRDGLSPPPAAPSRAPAAAAAAAAAIPNLNYPPPPHAQYHSRHRPTTTTTSSSMAAVSLELGVGVVCSWGSTTSSAAAATIGATPVAPAAGQEEGDGTLDLELRLGVSS
jgi:hypothetical protein